MPTNYTVHGNTNIIWGSSTAGALGICVSASKKEAGEKTTIKNENGNTVTAVFFDDRDEIEFEFIMLSTVTIPVRGAYITVCGLSNVLVDETEIKWAQGKEQMVSCKGTYYASGDFTP